MRRFVVILGFLAFTSSFQVVPSAVRGVSSRYTQTSTSLDAAVESGDKVLIIGGTGGVGQLVTKKLRKLSDVDVRVTARNSEEARETIGDEEVEICEVDLLADKANALAAALEGVSAVLISVGTTAFPTMRWRGGNTPDAIDNVAVARIAKLASNVSGMKRIVLLTSIGVDRTDEMPFVILNLFGVLDAKRNGENAVKEQAQAAGIEYAIVRPGRLVGGPYTNIDFVKLLEIEGGTYGGGALRCC